MVFHLKKPENVQRMKISSQKVAVSIKTEKPKHNRNNQ